MTVLAAGRAATEQQPCRFGECERTDTRPYAAGKRWFCPDHTPARLAGRPEPDTARYCLAVCYCGRCPHRGRVVAPIGDNVVDFRHKASGKRRSTLAAYREAQANTSGGAA